MRIHRDQSSVVWWVVQGMHHGNRIRSEPSGVEPNNCPRVFTGPGAKFHQLSPVLASIRRADDDPLPRAEANSVIHRWMAQSPVLCAMCRCFTESIGDRLLSQ